MGVRAGEHLGIQAREHAGEHARGQTLEIADANAGDHRSNPPAHDVGALVGRALQAEAEVLVDVSGEAPPGDHARLVSGASEEHAG